MVEIPAYYVDMDTGLTLAKDLQLYNRSMVRVVLLPSSQPIFGHWQFALIIVGVMLITSILAICRFFFFFFFFFFHSTMVHCFFY